MRRIKSVTWPGLALLALLAVSGTSSSQTTTQGGGQGGGGAASAKTFKDWVHTCEKIEGFGQEQCYIFQNIALKKTGKRLLHFAVGYVGELRQLHGAVAVDTGARRAPLAVLVDEGLDDLAPERVSLVEDVVRDAERLARTPRVLAVLRRAAAADLLVPARVPQVHCHADAVVSLLREQRRGDRRVDAAAHRHEHTTARLVHGRPSEAASHPGQAPTRSGWRGRAWAKRGLS